MDFTNKKSAEATTSVGSISIKYTVNYEEDKFTSVAGTIYKEDARIGSVAAGKKFGNLNLSIDRGIENLTEKELKGALTAISKDIVELFK